jgi:hypothetical protein
MIFKNPTVEYTEYNKIRYKTPTNLKKGNLSTADSSLC